MRLSRRRPEGAWCESLAFRLMSSDVVAAPKAAMASSRLLGKSAVITGAAKGIGRATAELFALEGARIVAGDRDADGLNRLCEHLESQGAIVAAVVGDVSKPEDARNMVEAAGERYGRLDVLVANAGIIPLRNINEATPGGLGRGHGRGWPRHVPLLQVRNRGNVEDRWRLDRLPLLDLGSCRPEESVDLRAGEVRRLRAYEALGRRVGR